MKSRSFFFQNIDRNVIFTMAFCIVVALTVLAFRYKSYVPCVRILISVKSNTLYTGESINFKAEIHDETTEVSWKIGDSIIDKNKREIWHRFNTPGRYVVTLITNQDCSTNQEIIIGEAPPKPKLRPHFTGPSQVTVGEIARFKDTTTYASSWKWRFGETGGIDAHASEASFVFKEEGRKTVILVINDTIQGEMVVWVNPKKEKQITPIKPSDEKGTKKQDKPNSSSPTDFDSKPRVEEPIKITKRISRNEIQTFLMQIVEGKKTAADLNEYLCHDENTQATLNGEQKTFLQVCEEFKKLRKGSKVINVTVNYKTDADSTCIQLVNVDLNTKKKFFGIF